MIEELIKKWSNPGYTTANEHRLILNLIDKLKTSYPIVEIGTWEGRTTAMMAEFCSLKSLENKIIGIDTFQVFDYYGEIKLAPDKTITEKNILPFSNVSLIEGFSNDEKVIKQIDKVSLLFIDGNHSYSAVQSDITNWFPKVQEYCLFHDYNLPDISAAIRKSGLKIDKIIDTIAVIKKDENINNNPNKEKK